MARSCELAMGITSRLEGVELPLLDRVSRSRREDLLVDATVLDLPPREQVLTEGRIPGHLLFPLDGPVELYARCGAKSVAIVVSPARHPFILAAVVKNAPCLMSARTIGATRILFLPAGRFRDALQRDAGLGVTTAEELSRAFRVMVRHLRSQKLRTATTRLAAYLAQECRSQSGQETITLTLSKRLIASLLGLEPESLSRCFAILAAEGIHVHDDVIAIADVERLRVIAAFDRLLDEPE